MISKKIRLSGGYTVDAVTGKRKQIRKQITVHCRNKTELERNIALEKIKYREEQKELLSHNTMDGLIDWYFATTNLKPKTLANNIPYIQTIRNNFGKKDVAKITSQEILFFLEDLKSHGYTPHILHCYFKTFNKLFNIALDEGTILRNPMKSLKKMEYATQPKPKAQPNIIPAVKRLIELTFSADDPLFDLQFKVMLLLSCDCCLRNAELYGLQWDDIDLEKKTLSIDRISYQLTQKQASILQTSTNIVSEPKSNCSARTLPLSTVTVNLLKKFKSHCESYLTERSCTNKENILFFQRINKRKKERKKEKCGVNVTRAYGSGFNSRLNTICKKYHLPADIASHKIRKAAITLRAELDISHRVCEYILGHDQGRLNSAYYIETERAVEQAHKPWEDYLNGMISSSDFSKN